VLTHLQQASSSGLLSQAMSSYVVWLAERMEALKTEMPEQQRHYRTEAQSLAHARYADTHASLRLGWERYFAVEAGAITEDEAATLHRRGVLALTALARAQAAY
jgi:uncharacterized protein YmfQ (DUF2313 family)